jgi:hypothetical protein
VVKKGFWLSRQKLLVFNAEIFVLSWSAGITSRLLDSPFTHVRAGCSQVTLDLEAVVSIICALEASAKLGGDSSV